MLLYTIHYASIQYASTYYRLLLGHLCLHLLPLCARLCGYVLCFVRTVVLHVLHLLYVLSALLLSLLPVISHPHTNTPSHSHTLTHTHTPSHLIGCTTTDGQSGCPRAFYFSSPTVTNGALGRTTGIATSGRRR
jgi:hypothetical protein